jgi:hypothetical protein
MKLRIMKTISLSKWVAITAVMLLGSLVGFAQVNRSLGTIPPGGTVTMTFDVVINTNFPVGTSSVTNQGSITGTGFGPILTDDPATAPLNDPTVIAVTVAPQIACPSDIVTNPASACSLPSIAFAATVTAGMPAPVLTYKLGATTITSPYVFPPGTNTVTVTATNGTAPNAVCSFRVTVLPVSPQLTILKNQTNVILSWPLAFSCYRLQFTPALSSNVWTLHPGPFTTNGPNIYVTNAITTTNRFFRLIY